MKFQFLKPAGAALVLLLVCLNPENALDAASGALSQWALSVAPALLPFLIAAPALTTPEVCALFSRVTGGFLRLFRLPENATGALLVGFLSGSPGGAAALSSVPRSPSDLPGAYLRAALMASGASPAFLLTGVAIGMLQRPELGWLLLRSQLVSVFLTGILIRPVGRSCPVLISSKRSAPSGAVLNAMQTLLIIGGCMTLFSVLARQLSLLTSPALETPLLALMELAGGCRALASLPHTPRLVLPLISAASCFGGISVYAQCMSFLSPLGVDPLEYAAGKLIQAALAALLTHLQLTLSNRTPDPLFLSLAILFVTLILLSLYLPHHRCHETPASSVLPLRKAS